MTRNFKMIALAVALLTMFARAAYAEEYKLGDISIEHPTARATVSGQKVGAGYVAFVNNGSSEDKLIGARADFAGLVEIHEMKMVDDVMQMRHLPEGLQIPAGETVELLPGGYHIMFMQLKEPLTAGEKKAVVLTFEKAGQIEIEFQVKSIAETLNMKKQGGS